MYVAKHRRRANILPTTALCVHVSFFAVISVQLSSVKFHHDRTNGSEQDLGCLLTDKHSTGLTTTQTHSSVWLVCLLIPQSCHM